VPIIAVSAIVIAALIWTLNIQSIKANRAFVKAFNQFTGAEPPDASIAPSDALFKAIDDSPYLGKSELTGAYSEQIVSLLQDRTLADHELAKLVEDIEQRYLSQENILKRDARFGMFLMNVYLNASSIDPVYNDKLLALAKQVETLSPTRPQIFYMTGRVYMRQGKFEQGLAEFQHAAELAPDVFAAHWNLLAAYLQLGNDDQAMATLSRLKEIQPFTLETYQRVASLYTAAKRLDLAQAILEEALLDFPDNADLYAGIADVYAAQGKNDKARAAVSKAVELEPDLTDQAEEFLKLLEEGSLLR